MPNPKLPSGKEASTFSSQTRAGAQRYVPQLPNRQQLPAARQQFGPARAVPNRQNRAPVNYERLPFTPQGINADLIDYKVVDALAELRGNRGAAGQDAAPASSVFASVSRLDISRLFLKETFAKEAADFPSESDLQAFLQLADLNRRVRGNRSEDDYDRSNLPATLKDKPRFKDTGRYETLLGKVNEFMSRAFGLKLDSAELARRLTAEGQVDLGGAREPRRDERSQEQALRAHHFRLPDAPGR